MTKRRRRLAVQEHMEVAQQLYPVREFLLKLCGKIGTSYAKSARVSVLASRALATVDSLRSELEDCMFAENRGHLGDNATKVYYGPDDAVRTGREPLERRAGSNEHPGRPL